MAIRKEAEAEEAIIEDTIKAQVTIKITAIQKEETLEEIAIEEWEVEIQEDLKREIPEVVAISKSTILKEEDLNLHKIASHLIEKNKLSLEEAIAEIKAIIEEEMTIEETIATEEVWITGEAATSKEEIITSTEELIEEISEEEIVVVNLTEAVEMTEVDSDLVAAEVLEEEEVATLGTILKTMCPREATMINRKCRKPLNSLLSF